MTTTETGAVELSVSEHRVSEHRTVEGARSHRRLKTLAGADDGQATAEYALVMLAAASLAGLLLAWVTSTDAVGRLMDAVLDSILSGI